jgi:hypothetical protein
MATFEQYEKSRQNRLETHFEKNWTTMTSIDFYLLSHTIPAEYLCRIFPVREADRQNGTPESRLRMQRRHSLPSLYFFNFFSQIF